jgi:hypothetical protein
MKNVIVIGCLIFPLHSSHLVLQLPLLSYDKPAWFKLYETLSLSMHVPVEVLIVLIVLQSDDVTPAP